MKYRWTRVLVLVLMAVACMWGARGTAAKAETVSYAQGQTYARGWQRIGNTWYYFDNMGQLTKGWLAQGGKWYYFDNSGRMQTGWREVDSKWYYFKKDGAMAASEWCGGYWLNKDGTWTYKYKATWKKSAKGWWFGDTSGWYAKNQTLTIDGKKYTFDKKGYLK